MGDVVPANSSGKANRTFVVVAFGLAGAAFGWGAERISQNALHHFASTWLFPNLLLLLGLIAGLAFCEALRWLRLQHSACRYLLAALLVPTNGLLGAWAGLLAALGAWLPLGSLARSGIISHRVSSALFMICLVGADIFASVAVLSLALYALARRWRADAWAALMVCGCVAAGVSFAIAPNFLLQQGWILPTGPVSPHFIFLTQTLYTACAGYWLADNRAESLRSKPGDA